MICINAGCSTPPDCDRAFGTDRVFNAMLSRAPGSRLRNSCAQSLLRRSMLRRAQVTACRASLVWTCCPAMC